MFTFAHLSDIHLAPLPRVTAGDLLNKRVLGYLSWHRKRKHWHRLEILDRLQGDLTARAPDHLCITGDLVNIALPAEIEAAARWLEQLAPGERISLVPGNHDAYLAASLPAFRARFAGWMSPAFPFVHRRGPVAFVGLSTAVATPPFFASGRLGQTQLQALEALLHTLKGEGLLRVVMLHHPPQTGVVGRRKGLDDAAAFRSVIARAGADLVLHGHMHKALRADLAGPDGAVPVFGVGSASFDDPARPDQAAQYRLFALDGDQLTVTSCNYDRKTTLFSETVLERLTVRAAAR